MAGITLGMTVKLTGSGHAGRVLRPVAAARRDGAADAIPRDECPRGEMPPEVAYQLIHDELMLDGNAQTQPRDVRDDVDGAGSREADGRVFRQEHDR